VRASTVYATTKVSAAAYNLRTAIVACKSGNSGAARAVTGIVLGDVIVSSPGYLRFSDSALKTGGVATVKIKSAGFVSITGITSHAFVVFNWMPY